MKDCVFCDLISGRSAALVVFEDEYTFVFLDRRPLFPGHCLVVPKRHVETLSELPPELIDPLFSVVQRLSVAVPEATEARGSFVAMNNIVSQSVPHLHVHVVPRNPKDGLKGFFWPRTTYKTEEEAEKVRQAVADRLCLD